MPLTLRYMHPNDVPQVVAIDELSFPDAWSYRSYMFELNESQVSHMVVLQEGDSPLPPAAPRSNVWQRFLNRLQGKTTILDNYPASPTILAYGGLWNIKEEAHISTIATHPTYRGHNYGEIVLAGMIQKSLALHAEYIVLEVRVSNHVAQALYAKYGFVNVHTNKAYYRNGEDAYDMRLQLNSAHITPQLQALYDALQAKKPFQDDYSTIQHARLGV